MNEGRISNSSWAALIGIGVAATLLRLHLLIAGVISLDEGYTLLLGRAGLLETIARGPCDRNPPLAGPVYHWWFMLFGEGRFAAEMLSVIAGGIGVVLIGVLAHRVYGERAGWIAALLTAISKLDLLISQYVRVYALGIAAATLSIILLLAALGTKARDRWIYFSGASLILINLHYYGALVVYSALGGAAFLEFYRFNFRIELERRNAGTNLKLLFITGTLITLLTLPTVYWQSRVLHELKDATWIPPVSLSTFASIWYQFASESLPLLVLLGSLFLFGFRAAVREDDASGTTVLVAWLFGPIAVAVVFSLLGGSIFHLRYFVFCLPPFLILAARGICALADPFGAPHWITGGVLILLLPLSVPPLHNYFTGVSIEAAQSTPYNILSERIMPGDLVLHTTKCSYLSSIFEHDFKLDETVGNFGDDLWVLECAIGRKIPEGFQNLPPFKRLWILNTDCFPTRARKGIFSRKDFSELQLNQNPLNPAPGLYLFERGPN